MNAVVKGGLVVVGCYLFFLLSGCPADRVVPRLPLPPELHLTGITGSIWHGEVDRVDWRNTTLRKVSWSLPISSFLLFQPAIQLTFADPNSLMGRAEVRLLSQPKAQDVSLKANADWLQTRGGIALPVTLSGKVQLELEELEMAPNGCVTLDGALNWSGAGLNSQFGNVQLDKAKADLSCEKGKIIAKIKQHSEQLAIEGRAEITLPAAYHLVGTLTPGKGLPDSLSQGLSFLGQRDSQGRVRLDFSGRF